MGWTRHKQTVALLNKLTREKFTDHAPDPRDRVRLEAPSEADDLLHFDKALREPHFSELYADVCLALARESEARADRMVSVREEDGRFFFDCGDPEEKLSRKAYATEAEARKAGRKASSFKRILLNKCQEEFEKKVDWGSFEERVDWEAAKKEGEAAVRRPRRAPSTR